MSEKSTQPEKAYRKGDLIYSGNGVTLCHGFHSHLERPVIIMEPEQQKRSGDLLNYIRHAYEISRNIKCDSVLKPIDIMKSGYDISIIYENFDGVLLSDFLKDNRTDLLQKLNLSCSISEALRNIHNEKVIHKAVQPEHIFVNPYTLDVKFTGMFFATVLERECQEIRGIDRIEGNLYYISPEHTGRMNRSIDSRSDIYSLGITLYQLFTGKVPFSEEDPLKIIYSHMTKSPEPLHTVNKDLPEMLSQIVLKCLEKDATNRYQSIHGLNDDLEKCQAEYENSGHIPLFVIGRNDYSTRFPLPEKMYGRDREISILKKAFIKKEEKTGGVFLVSGPPGIGKTFLVSEAHKSAMRIKQSASDYFVTGKFDQYQRDVPYLAIKKAIQNLVKLLLTETDERIRKWKKSILDATGINGRIMLDLAPNLIHIIGPQPPVEELPSAQSLNRFQMVVSQFIKVFARGDNSLILYMDDFQWADDASRGLIRHLISDPEIKSLIFVLVYRDNEPDLVKHIEFVIENIEQQGIVIKRIALKPLLLEDIITLLSENLKCELDDAGNLADLLMNKTEGNPFFIHELCNSLYQDQLLRYQYETHSWVWDIDKIRKKGITNNVVELMTERIKKLPEETRRMMQYAACIGSVFNLGMLSVACRETVLRCISILTEAVKAGILIPSNEAYRYFQHETLIQFEEIKNPGELVFHFLHDRVHQATYEMLDRNQAMDAHLYIGRHMLRYSSEADISENLFSIVNHYGHSLNIIDDEPEKKTLIPLFIRASRRARMSGAYQGALKYASEGIALLGDDCWPAMYKHTLDLHIEKAEAEYLNLNFDDALKIISTVIEKAQSSFDKTKAYIIQINLHITRFEDDRAIDIGLEALKLFNINIPTNPSREEIQEENKKLETILSGHSLESLLRIKKLDDPETDTIMQIMRAILMATAFVRINLFSVLCARMSIISIQKGYSGASNIGFACYAFMEIFNNSSIEKPLMITEYALKLCQHQITFAHRSLFYWIYYMHLSFYVKDLSEHNKAYLLCVESSETNGDINSLHYAHSANLCDRYLMGEQLNRIMEMTPGDRYYSFFFQRLLNMLSSGKDDLLSLDTTGFNEDEYFTKLSMIKSALPKIMHCAFRFRSLYLAGQFSKILYLGDILFEIRDYHPIIGSFIASDNYLIYMLAILSVYPDADTETKKKYDERLSVMSNKIKVWASWRADVFEHKYLIFSAESARVKGDILEAQNLYDAAVELSAKNRFINDEALANELACRYYFSLKKYKIAYIYLKEACHCYALWGAHSKVNLLKQDYSKLIEQNEKKHSAEPSEDIKTAGISVLGQKDLDLSTIIKASQSISGEMNLEMLLDKLMTFVFEHAGAQNGCLILAEDNSLVIRAEKKHDAPVVTKISIEADTSRNVALSVIQYVARTLDHIILNNAAMESEFRNDPYISENSVKSVLCIPIVQMDRLIGMIYLENNTTTSAFTEDHISILSVLSSQAAISLENSMLYNTMEQKVRKRTKDLSKANDKISRLNEMLKSENVRMSSELDVAKELQKMILPLDEELDSIEPLDISAYMSPADEVGGDYYDVIDKNGTIIIAIGDVTSHGLKSGTVMLMAQTAVQTLTLTPGIDTKNMMKILNRVIFNNSQRMSSDRTMTFSLLIYQNGQLNVIGQHEDVIIIRKNGNLEIIDTSGLGLPLGLVEDPGIVFEMSPPVSLEPGDGFVVFTDGITEAENKANEMYGFEKLCDVLKKMWLKKSTADEIRDGIITDALSFIGDEKILDDITLIVARAR